MFDTGPGNSAESEAYQRAKLGQYYYLDHHAGGRGGMPDLRLLNLIAFGMLLLAFFIAVGKSDHRSASEKLMIERMKTAAEIIQTTNHKEPP